MAQTRGVRVGTLRCQHGDPMNPQVANPFDLTGRIAVVTGGTGALGGASARALAAAGAEVVVVGRNADRGEQVCRDIRKTGGTSSFIGADVVKSDDLHFLIEELTDRYPGIDILVNAAGGHVTRATYEAGSSLPKFDAAGLREVMDLNFVSTVELSFGLVPLMSKGTRGSGAIVNFSSMTASHAVTRLLGYGASKAAVDNATRWLAERLARAERTIRVNAVAPGWFLSDATRPFLTDGDGYTQRGKTVIAGTPMGRFGELEEIGGAVVFLASEASSFITGVVLNVDGGFKSWTGV